MWFIKVKEKNLSLLSGVFRKVKWLAPFTKDELNMRGIVDVMFDLGYLSTLYPNIPKACFEECRPKKEEEILNGYSKRKLKWIVEDEPSELPNIDIFECDDILASLVNHNGK